MKKRRKLEISVKLIAVRKNSILKINQYNKSDNMPYIIYANLECLVKK